MKPSNVLNLLGLNTHDSKDSARRETANRQGMAKTSAKRHDAGLSRKLCRRRRNQGEP